MTSGGSRGTWASHKSIKKCKKCNFLKENLLTSCIRHECMYDTCIHTHIYACIIKTKTEIYIHSCIHTYIHTKSLRFLGLRPRAPSREGLLVFGNHSFEPSALAISPLTRSGMYTL